MYKVTFRVSYARVFFFFMICPIVSETQPDTPFLKGRHSVLCEVIAEYFNGYLIDIQVSKRLETLHLLFIQEFILK